MGTHANDAATFLVQTLFELYILVVMLRFLFQLVRADFYNPISQFIVRATNPPLVALRRVVPGMAGIDLSSVVLLLALELVELWLISGIHGASPPFLALLVLGVAELLQVAVNVFFFSILIQVILSWVNPGLYNPVTGILHSLNEPLLGPARRMVPPISGFDLSPIVVMIGLKLCEILVIGSIRDVARAFV